MANKMKVSLIQEAIDASHLQTVIERKAQFELKSVNIWECRIRETLSIFGRETQATFRCSLQWDVCIRH